MIGLTRNLATCAILYDEVDHHGFIDLYLFDALPRPCAVEICGEEYCPLSRCCIEQKSLVQLAGPAVASERLLQKGYCKQNNLVAT